MTDTNILIVDDDALVRSSLVFLLKHAGYQPAAVASPEEAIEAIRRHAPRLVLMDMNFSLTTTGEEGLLLLKQVKVLEPALPVILMTAWGSITLAVQGMQAGAFDFITKPWNNLMLLKSVRNAFDLTEKTDEEPALNRSRFGKIVGKSPQLTAILQTVSRIAPTTASVLITGESGTGKELIAEAIHENSQRAEEPFVKVNLGGLTQSLFESELFGHKKGAFTDAYADRTGRFELANHGTIFLDEIGDLELSSQVKLLRVLQDQTFEPLGESRPHKVDVRVVSATNRDLPTMVAERTFREDLYYRINLITIHLPALRERREDIPLLVRHFADRLAETNALPHVDFSPEALAYLHQLPFPGNIRELKNLVERTLLVSGKTHVEASDFIQFGNPTLAANQSPSTSSTSPLNGLTLEELERQGILQALERYGNNLTQAALALGISRAALYRRMEKHHIKL